MLRQSWRNAQCCILLQWCVPIWEEAACCRNPEEMSSERGFLEAVKTTEVALKGQTAFRQWGVKIRCHSWGCTWPFGWPEPRRKWGSVLIEADCQVKLSFNFLWVSVSSSEKKRQLKNFFFLKKDLFISFLFWLWWVFVVVRRLSLVAVSGGYSFLQYTGFSLWWLLLLRSMGSRHLGFSSCSSRAQ